MTIVEGEEPGREMRGQLGRGRQAVGHGDRYPLQAAMARQVSAVTSAGTPGELIVLVDAQGRVTGPAPKLASHTTRTPLHLAFSCYVFDRAGNLLLTQRAWGKKTWPGAWTNTCCGHPAPGEDIRAAVHRRVGDELAARLITVALILPGFRYEAVNGNADTNADRGAVMNAIDIGGATWRPAFTDDPHPFFAEQQVPAPVSRGELDGVPVWLITRYDDVRRLLADPSVSSDPRHAGPAAGAVPWVGANNPNVLTRHIVRLDHPGHTRLRKLVVRAFTARRVEAMRPRVQQITDELVARLLPRGRADLVSDFALPIPITVISELLGVPEDGRQQFLSWGNIYLGVDEGDIGRRPEAVGHLSEYLGGLIDRKSGQHADAAGGASLLAALLAGRDDGDPLSHDELLAMAFLLLIAGYETTAGLIGNGMLALLHRPDQLAALRADPSRIGAAIEEFLRYNTPVNVTALPFTTAEIEGADAVIPAGAALGLLLIAANPRPAPCQ